MNLSKRSLNNNRIYSFFFALSNQRKSSIQNLAFNVSQILIDGLILPFIKWKDKLPVQNEYAGEGSQAYKRTQILLIY